MPAPQTEKQAIKIPLVGAHTTRIVDNSTSVPGESGTIGRGIIGKMVIGRITTTDKDQRFSNVLFEKIVNPFTQKETYYATKRPGFAADMTPAAGQVGNALKVWSSQGNGDKVVSAFGSVNSEIFLDTVSLGSITGIAQHIDETILAGVPTIVITSNNNTAWYYPEGGALTKITDADFPGNAGKTITGRFVSIDGYLFIMATDGTIWNSDLNSITSWSSLSFLSAQMYPDKGVGLARIKNQLVAFGKDTIEFFHISANATGSPLERTDNAFLRIGCASNQSYTQLEDTLAWISSSDRGGCSVYILDGFTPKRISTSVIDSQLALAGPESAKIMCAKFVGKTLVFTTISNLTFVHSLEDSIWTEWKSNYTYWGDISVAVGASWKIYSISKTYNSGKVYAINPSSFIYTDDGIPYTFLIQTVPIDFDTNKRKFFSRLNLFADKQPTSTTLSLSWSDDDYQTFSTTREVDLSSNNPYITQMGSARRRIFKFSNTSNGPLRLEGFELEFTEGIH